MKRLRKRLGSSCSYTIALLALNLQGIHAEETLSRPKAVTQDELREKLRMMMQAESSPSWNEAVITLFVDKKHLAEVVGRVDTSGAMPKLQYRDLLKWYKDIVQREDLIDLGEHQDLDGWVSVKYLEKYQPEFNQETLVVQITPPVSLRPTGDLDLRSRFHPNLESAVGPTGPSARVNINNLVTGDGAEYHYTLDLDAAVSAYDWVAEGRIAIDPEAKEKTLTYKNLRLVQDYPDLPARFSIGENQAFNPRMLTADRIQGMKFGTEYQLNPYVVTEPISEYSFFLDRDSLVEIFVDGQLTETLRLKAGPYDLFNLPLRLGLNQVTLKITDDLGKERFLYYDAIKGVNLLDPSRQEYTVSFGVEGQGDQYSNDAIFSASYRRGIDEELTGSMEMQLADGYVSGGVGTDFVTRWFHGSLDFAGTWKDSEFGSAMRFVAARTFKNWSASFRVDVRDEHYLARNQTLSSTRIRRLNELAVLVPRIGNYGSLRFTASDRTQWAGEKERKALLDWTYHLNDNWTLRVEGIYRSNRNPRTELKGLLTYSFVGENYRFTGSGQTNESQKQVRGEWSGVQNGHWPDWRMRLSQISPDDGDAYTDVFGTMRYQNSYLNAFYNVQGTRIADDNDYTQSLSLSTALAYADGLWGIGQPSVDSFALVKGEGNLGKTNLNIFGGPYPTHATPEMAGLVAGLRSYGPSLIRVESDDPYLDVENGAFLVVPTYKSGIALKIKNTYETAGLVYVTGVLHDEIDRPISLKKIVLVDLNNPDEEPIISFTNQNGFFRAVGLSQDGQYQIMVERRPRRGLIEVLFYDIPGLAKATMMEDYDIGPVAPSRIMPKGSKPTAPLAPELSGRHLIDGRLIVSKVPVPSNVPARARTLFDVTERVLEKSSGGNFRDLDLPFAGLVEPALPVSVHLEPIFTGELFKELLGRVLFIHRVDREIQKAYGFDPYRPGIAFDVPFLREGFERQMVAESLEDEVFPYLDESAFAEPVILVGDAKVLATIRALQPNTFEWELVAQEIHSLLKPINTLGMSPDLVPDLKKGRPRPVQMIDRVIDARFGRSVTLPTVTVEEPEPIAEERPEIRGKQRRRLYRLMKCL